MLADKFHVSSIGYFGSYSTGQQTEESDIDLFVEFSEPVGWEFFTLKFHFLEEGNKNALLYIKGSTEHILNGFSFAIGIIKYLVSSMKI